MYDPWGVGHMGQLVSESRGDTFPLIFWTEGHYHEYSPIFED